MSGDQIALSVWLIGLSILAAPMVWREGRRACADLREWLAPARSEPPTRRTIVMPGAMMTVADVYRSMLVFHTVGVRSLPPGRRIGFVYRELARDIDTIMDEWATDIARVRNQR